MEADVEVAGEGRSPALVEDCLVDRFDGAICLRAAGVDAADADAVHGDSTAETLAAKLLPVIGEHALEPPARSAARVMSARRCLPGGATERDYGEAGLTWASVHQA